MDNDKETNRRVKFSFQREPKDKSIPTPQKGEYCGTANLFKKEEERKSEGERVGGNRHVKKIKR